MLTFPSPGDLPNPRVNQASPAWQVDFYHRVWFQLLLVLIPFTLTSKHHFSQLQDILLDFFLFGLILASKGSIFTSYSIIPQYCYLICPRSVMYAGNPIESSKFYQ